MSSRYASTTSVPVSRTREAIEHELERYGSTAFAFGWSRDGSAMIQFEYRGRQVKIDVRLPKGDPDSREYQQQERQRWRVLLLLIKAQLEAIESGLATFEEAFLPWMLLGDGSTVAQKMVPQLPPAKEAPRLRAVNDR